MKILVHSGGGSKGSFGVGVIAYLMGELKTNYHGYCGTSVGAINAAFLAQFPVGDEQLAAQKLKELWLTIDNSKIYTRWKPFGKIHAAWKLSFFDSEPLQHLVKDNIKLDKIRASNKQIAVGAVSLSSGKHCNFYQTDDDLIDAVLASSAFPGMLCPVKMRDQIWTDGGVKVLSNIKTAIDMGADEIDVITTSPDIRVKKFIEKPSIIDLFKRTVDLSTDKILSNDLEKVLMHNQLAEAGFSDKKIIKLRVFRPINNLIDDVLDFNPLKIREMIEKGYECAKKMVTM